MTPIEKFFAPRSVAVVGASATKGRPGRVAMENMVDNGFQGDIHPVNPRGGRIMGRRVWRSIMDLPHGIDMAVVILPAAQTVEAVEQCAARGIAVVVLVAGGFAEVDDLGEDRQAELRRVIAKTGVRVLGPNTAGHISTPGDFASTFFPLGRIPRGNISYVSQTGNFAGAMIRHIISEEHFGLARTVGLGNTVDIDETDVFEFLADDDETSAILFYLESLKRPDRFFKVARRVTRKKPVVLLKGGSTDEGAVAALSHTASLCADDRILDGALRQSGIVRIREFSHLILAAKAMAPMPLPAGNRVAFVTPSGEFAVHLSDLCRETMSLEFPALEARTLKRLRAISPPFINIANPVDIFPAVTVHGTEIAYAEAIGAVLDDPGIDAVGAIMILTPELAPDSYQFIVDLAQRHPAKPVYISFSGDTACDAAAKAFLEPRGVPTFPRIEDPFKALDILARCRAAMTRR